MSTAGKVLVVLNALVLVVWLVLMAGVTELNSNGAKRVADLEKEVDSAKAELAQIQKDVREGYEKINLEQISKEEDLRVLRSNLSNAERHVSTAIETASRLQVEVEEYSKAVARSEEIAQQRREEKAELEQQQAAEETLVKNLQTENGSLLEELEQLRSRFKEITEANRAEVDKILQGSAVRSAGRRVSPRS
ncbi:MAG: hypothetical protein SFX72_19590 [Isosphaeraceae bacterium]|nr:hypothetical protein [Isosphaeraceae bacterium]